MNTINQSNLINVNGVYENNVITANTANAVNEKTVVNNDDTAAVLELSENVNADGVVLVKNSESVEEIEAVTRASNQSYQSMLSDLDFYTGPIDGNLSSTLSTKAIKNFQRVYGLSQTGSFNATTQSKLQEVYDFFADTRTDAQLVAFTQNYGMTGNTPDNMAMTWTFLIKGMGLSKVQAAGAMGNIMEASIFSPTNAEDAYYPNINDSNYSYSTGDGIGYGLLQWKASSRKQNLQSIATSMGVSVGNINAQFAAMKAESNSSAYTLNGWNNLRSSGSLEAATQIFRDQIEINSSSDFSDRLSFARAIYSALV